ncbi:MAG: hypothetical protein RLZZ445_1940, partial [Pseudomonadota bacterium]
MLLLRGDNPPADAALERRSNKKTEHCSSVFNG